MSGFEKRLGEFMRGLSEEERRWIARWLSRTGYGVGEHAAHVEGVSELAYQARLNGHSHLMFGDFRGAPGARFKHADGLVCMRMVPVFCGDDEGAVRDICQHWEGDS
jgi:hypothetical protein